MSQIGRDRIDRCGKGRGDGISRGREGENHAVESRRGAEGAHTRTQNRKSPRRYQLYFR